MFTETITKKTFRSSTSHFVGMCQMHTMFNNIGNYHDSRFENDLDALTITLPHKSYKYVVSVRTLRLMKMSMTPYVSTTLEFRR